MELTNELKATYIETAKVLKGSDRRVFMARIVQALGRGGQSQAARELGWCRDTIRKGMRELESGHRIVDNFRIFQNLNLSRGSASFWKSSSNPRCKV